MSDVPTQAETLEFCDNGGRTGSIRFGERPSVLRKRANVSVR